VTRVRFIFAAMLVLLCAAMPGTVTAAPRSIELPRPCMLVTAPDTTPAQVMARRAEFHCGDPKPGKFSVTNWALIDGLSLKRDPADPWVFRHALVRDTQNSYYFVHADGAILRSPTSAMEARQILSSGDVRYALPDWPSPVTGILVRVGDLHSLHGMIPRAGIDTRSVVARTTAQFHLFYGVIVGLLVAMLAYNLMLYLVLRHAFLLRYCAFTACTLVFAGTWSGAIFFLIPGLTTFGQVAANNFAIGALIFTAPRFMISFLETGTVSPRIERALRLLSPAPLAIAIVRLLLPETLWQLFDVLFYGAILSTLAGMVWAGIVAWRNGSRAIRTFAISWTVPFAFASARVLWALGLFPVYNALFDIGLFVVLAMEALISALGMTLRIRALRTERDDARALEQTLRTLAETDPMTGLLNRRAFLERARDGTHDKRLILVDIDRFKSINDSFGHDVGDQVIVAVANALKTHSPDQALVGRMGGEEFAVLVPADTAGELAYRLREAVETPAFENGPPVTISAGVAEGAITSEQDWRLLYIAADEALYEAKNAGRNRVKHAFAAGPLTEVMAG
jgi:diguanylate cyclase (GGDEF)-like protein